MQTLNLIYSVKTNSGTLRYTSQELDEMLADRAMYECADNLPKWLFMQSMNWKMAWQQIEEFRADGGVLDVRNNRFN